MEFYAHSKKDSAVEDWQLLEDHLQNVAETAAMFAASFGGEEWGEFIARYHDLGKFTKSFQAYLLKENDLPMGDLGPYYRSHNYHQWHGANLAFSSHKQLGKLAACLIGGHHGGLQDWTELKDKLGKNNLPPLAVDSPVMDFSQLGPSCMPIFKNGHKANGLQISLFMRMLFSCLVDADFLDTESFLEPEAQEDRNVSCSLVDLKTELDAFLKSIEDDSKEINRKRNTILGSCRSAAEKEPGLFSLTVPTGGGKTLSSMAFALDHAIRFRKKRIIYVIPFTSIIEQNADVFRKVFANYPDAVLEHHSNFDPEKETRFSRLSSQNWDAPIVVTTNVQFFESLFAAKTSRCRKLHNIVDSVIILDEAQMLPCELLRPTLETVKELVRIYNTSFVFCTATQPAFTRVKGMEMLRENTRKIMSDPDSLYQEFKRVHVSAPLEHVLSDDELAEELSDKSQALCIVSSKKHARCLYQKLQNCQGSFHLSTFMCPEHRSDKLSQIRQRLQNNEPCIVVSTQLIEAGVDVDFPFVFRSLAGIDSIAQAAGRCNREGKLDAGEVIVFKPEYPIPPMLRHFAEIGELVLEQHPDDPLSLASVKDYFHRLYQDRNLDKKQIINDLTGPDSKKLQFPFRTLSEKYRMIENDSIPILIPYGDKGEMVTRRITTAEEFLDRKTRQQAQRFTVQVYKPLFNKLRNHEAITPYLDEQYWILDNSLFYDDTLGLFVEDDMFYKAEDLMV